MWHKQCIYYCNKVSLDQRCTQVKLCGHSKLSLTEMGLPEMRNVLIGLFQGSTKERFTPPLVAYKGSPSRSVGATINMFVHFCIGRNVD